MHMQTERRYVQFIEIIFFTIYFENPFLFQKTHISQFILLCIPSVFGFCLAIKSQH